MACPICKFAKCRWVKLKKNPEKLSTEELERVVNHNTDYIEMVFSGYQGSADAEERMYDELSLYCDEIERRKEK